ncbi:hypothetical protein CAPTEDRAFT_123623 [Capitella teleta]|uniref:Phosphatidylinositol-3,4,5-trisphosphate 3-phosphatase n=1 Tax=Capitella teleta TaxID=283909 RepID=R7UBR2_CAPTE|nr:hypothetical protein CAPTEDRAFT_123623 [Capitella teleta]|eukprot:ELU01243.1 hypothetical protein CAPTEDRAFT_123623 [Capitella teleta]
MDVTYITERIIVMSFPWEGYDDIYRQSVKEASRMLNDKHGDGYLILNISEKRSILNKCNKQVLDFGWPQRLAPPLERLCGVCKAVDSWLNTDPRHVAVIHSKGERGRSGVIVASYMHYSNICASADQALDRFAMKKFYDDKLGGVTQPSQRRYVHYFAGLLSGGIKMNSSPIYLNHVIIHGVPDFDGRGSCRPFIKVYQGMEPVFVSGIYQVTANQPRICISLDPSLSLKGDVLVKCFHKRPRSNIRDIVFRCQFHTCAVSNHGMTLQKHELDDACDDPRFPDASKVELMFSAHPVKFKRESIFLIIYKTESQEFPPHFIDYSSVDPLERWDSYENFNSLPNQGPLDGSLYATVSKVRSERVNGGLHNGPLTQSADSGISSTSGECPLVVML